MKKWCGICRLGSIGDNLIVSSVLPLLKGQGYMIEVMAQEPSHVVFENNPYIDKLTVLKKQDLPDNNADWQKYFVGRSHEYDKFYHLSHSIESHVAYHPDSTWFWWPDAYRRQLANKSYLALTHDICELPHEFAPEFFPTEEERDKALETKEKIGKQFIAWVIAGSRLDKLYPYSAMAVARLIVETGLPVVMMGGTPKEFEAAESIMEHVGRQNGTTTGLHLAMKAVEGENLWPLRRSLTFIQYADLVISPDTGLAWGVASRPMPKIMLLGHASPFNITHGWVNTTTLHADQERVSCYPCHRLHNETSTCKPNKENNGAACISDISVEDILARSKECLAQNTSSLPTPRS